MFLFNGCSFTWGGDICKIVHDLDGNLMDHKNPNKLNQERIKLVYPYLVANHFNTPHINLAMGCGSNDRIVRTTLEFMFSNDNINFAFIQFTEPSRYETYIEETDEWTLSKCDINIMSHLVSDISRDKSEKHHQSMVENISNHQSSNKFFQQILLLHLTFKELNIPYLFTISDPTNLKMLSDWQLNKIKDFSWYMGHHYNFFTGIEMTTHPTIKGHSQIANNIITYLVENNIL